MLNSNRLAVPWKRNAAVFPASTPVLIRSSDFAMYALHNQSWKLIPLLSTTSASRELMKGEIANFLSSFSVFQSVCMMIHKPVLKLSFQKCSTPSERYTVHSKGENLLFV